jgi:hypothetical protein
MRYSLLIFSLCLSVFFVACDKSDNKSETYSRIAVTHAAHGTPGPDVILDGVVMNSDSLVYGQSAPYTFIFSGQRTFRLNKAGTAINYSAKDTFFDAEAFYSVFASDSAQKMKALLLKDDLSAPAAGKAHVRLLHLVPNAPAIDIMNDTTHVLNAIAYNTAQSFLPITAGTYQFKAVLTGTMDSVYQTDNLVLQDGKIYTCYLRSSATGISHALIQHN